MGKLRNSLWEISLAGSINVVVLEDFRAKAQRVKPQFATAIPLQRRIWSPPARQRRGREAAFTLLIMPKQRVIDSTALQPAGAKADPAFVYNL